MFTGVWSMESEKMNSLEPEKKSRHSLCTRFIGSFISIYKADTNYVKAQNFISQFKISPYQLCQSLIMTYC